MRHAKRSAKLGRDTSHRRCLFANMLKSLVHHEKILTTVPKAKELRRFAEQMITLAKDDTLAHRRLAVAKLMVRRNSLSSKERRAAKTGDKASYSIDRLVIDKLFAVLGPRFQKRQGGYTRISRMALPRKGDCAETCVLEYLPE